MSQSPDIAQGVDTAFEVRSGSSGEDILNAQGAGDQGMMFGYACDETEDLMPMPIWLAHRLAQRLAQVRKAGVLPYLRPDGKTQVTFEYEDGRPVRLRTVLISTQHNPNVDLETLLLPDLRDHVIAPLVPAEFADDGYKILANPTGKFELGGPHADAGLTGRKIIVDTYGGAARHGGGAFSGKDPSKVDRSAAYAARWVAKHVVASGAASRCEIQVAYAIGVARPVSLMVETFGTEKVDPAADRQGGGRGVRPSPGSHHPGPRPSPAHLPPHRGLRPLRPKREGVHLGAAQPSGRLQVGRRRLGTPLPPSGGVSPRSPGTNQVPPGSSTSPTVRVVTDVAGLDKEFDYVAPEGRGLEVGMQVRVDLAGRRVGGWVTATGVETHPDLKLRSIARVRGFGPPPDVVDLASWAAWRWAGRRAALLSTASANRAVPTLPRAALTPPKAPPAPWWPSGSESPRAGTTILQVPPASDPTALVAGIAQIGPTLVVVASLQRAQALAARLIRRGGDVALLPEGWAQARAGAGVVVGGRGAVWAPCPGLASIVVIDGHDEALWQEQAPTWSAVTVAVERARRAGAPCLILTPCPTPELAFLGESARVDRASERAGWAAVEVVDRRQDDPRLGLYSERLARVLRSDRGDAGGVEPKGPGPAPCLRFVR